VILNDLQIPFQDKRVLESVEKFMADFRPDLEIYAGDIFDFYSASSFDGNPSRLFNLQNELDMARAWLYGRAEANPDARKILILGNHEDRLRRWLWKHGRELNSLRALSVDSLLGLKEARVEMLEYMSIIDLLGFRIEHGYKATASRAYPVNVARYMATATSSSGLCGHTHHFSTYSWTTARGDHTYIENGCLSRMDLEYAPFPNWQHAFTFAVSIGNILYPTPVRVLKRGFMSNGEFYPVRRAA